MFSLVDRPLQIEESVSRNHSTDVGIGLEPFDGGREDRSRSKFLGAAHDHIVKFIVLRLVDDKFLETDAVLTGVLAK
jgi:hypothetical protein